MGSLTSLGGVPYLAMYSSTKAFKMSLCEAVGGELLAFNVDVSNVVAPLMNTPMYQNKIKDEDFAMGDAMLYECDDIARIALSKLGKQPLIVFPSDESMDPTLIEEPRYQALVQTMESAKTFFPRGQKITN
jgi:short-subunit dehydrogenase